MNELIFILHTFFIAAITLGALYLGKQALITLICFLGVFSNLLVVKQMTLFGFDVTCSDVFAVGGLLGLNLAQEYFGKACAQKIILLNFYMLVVYLAVTQFHLWYTPNNFDEAHMHFDALFSVMPRIIIASIGVYVFVQFLDTYLYGFLNRFFTGRYLVLRSMISLLVSQLLDTILFSITALYGIVGSVTHIIIVSYAIKVICIIITLPVIALAQRFIRKNHHAKF